MVSKFHPYTFDISLSSPFGKGREHYSFEQTWIPFTQGCLAVPNLIEIGPVVLEENIFKFHRCIFSIYIFSWPENVWPFIWRNLNPLTALYPRCFMLSLIEFALSGSGEFCLCIFAILFIISPSERAWVFIWRILKSLYPKMFCVKFDWNWPGGSWEEDF